MRHKTKYDHDCSINYFIHIKCEALIQENAFKFNKNAQSPNIEDNNIIPFLNEEGFILSYLLCDYIQGLICIKTEEMGSIFMLLYLLI